MGGWAATALRRACRTRSASEAGRSGTVVDVGTRSSTGGGTNSRFCTAMTSAWAKATRPAASFNSEVATLPSRMTVQSTTWTSTVGRPAWTMAPWTVAVRSCSLARSVAGSSLPRRTTAKNATRTSTRSHVLRLPGRPPGERRFAPRGDRPRPPSPKAGPNSRPRDERGSRIMPVTGGLPTGGSPRRARRQGRALPAAVRLAGLQVGQRGDYFLAEGGELLLAVLPEKE